MALPREAETPPNWWRIDLTAFTSSLRDPGVLFFFLIFFSLLLLLLALLFYCFLRGGRRRPGEPSPPTTTAAAAAGNKGLGEEAVKNLPEARYGSLEMVGRNECSICLGTFEDSETVKVMPECAHVFHGGCVDAWLLNRSSCPLCRASLDSTTSSVHIDII